MIKHLLIFVGLTLLLTGIGYAQDGTDSSQATIMSHYLIATLNPDNHTINAVDAVALTEPTSGEFIFSLNKNLAISRLYVGDVNLDYEVVPFEGVESYELADEEVFQNIKITLPDMTDLFTVEYSGEIYDPIDPSTALGRVRGDYTTGIIGPEGVYLSSSSGWYPDTEYSMAAYQLEIFLPETWTAVTQGDLVSRDEMPDSGLVKSIWDSYISSDGCVLVANHYVQTTREIAGVQCSTYFYQDDPALADSFLDKLEAYLPAYIELLGSYPYSRFDVVENFFTTGYGMPCFTLLGSMVLRMPYATAEGSLAHELVHNWWGNYVYVDWEKGNWCEGLTFFCTNYYWNILDGRPEDAEHFRFRSMVKYSVDVSPEEDYPVREFWTKLDEVDGDIGYDKSSAIFIMLHEMLGKDKFFEALRLGREMYGGKKTTWDDWEFAFETVSGRDLTDFFSSWLDNTGTPVIDIQDIEQVETDDGMYKLTFTITAMGDMFTFDAPFVVHLENSDLDMSVLVTGLELQCEISQPEPVVALEFDPGNYIFRRLTRDEIPPCLNTTFEGDPLLIVLPSGGDDEFLEVSSGGMGHPGMGGPGGPPATTQVSVKDHYQSLADQIIAGGVNATVKFDDEVTPDELASSSILCLGNFSQNSVAAPFSLILSEPVRFLPEAFEINETGYFEPGYSLLVTVRNPFNTEHDITFYMGTSPQAIFKASYMFFYGWDSYVVYQDGTPIDRGEWDMGSGPYYFEL